MRVLVIAIFQFHGYPAGCLTYNVHQPDESSWFNHLGRDRIEHVGEWCIPSDLKDFSGMCWNYEIEPLMLQVGGVRLYASGGYNCGAGGLVHCFASDDSSHENHFPIWGDI